MSYGCRPCVFMTSSVEAVKAHMFSKLHMFMVSWLASGSVSLDGVRLSGFSSDDNYRSCVCVCVCV